MKLSALTIFLIMITISSFVSCYSDVMVFNIIDKGTDKMIDLYEENKDSEFSSVRGDVAQSFLGMRQDARLRRDSSIFNSMTLICLLILSVKLDRWDK